MNPSTPFPSKSLPPAVGLKVNEVCDRFEAAWRGGKRPRVEDYVRDTPEPVLSPLLLELVHLEMEYRRLHGEDSHWDEYRSRFPSLPFEPPVEGSDLSPLSRAGRFELLDLIGRGGIGIGVPRLRSRLSPSCRREGDA